MRLNEKISEYYELTLENSSQRILSVLSDKKEKQIWSDFVSSDSVDFKEIQIQDNRLEIIRVPSVLNPFKASGKITFELFDTDNRQVKVRCKILLLDSTFTFMLGLNFIFFTMWTILCFQFISDNYITLLLVIPSWFVFGLIIYIGLLYTKRGLRNYSFRIVNQLMKGT